MHMGGEREGLLGAPRLALRAALMGVIPASLPPQPTNPSRREFHLSYGGEGGIRTLDGLLTHTPLAGARLRPLGHLSGQDISPFAERGMIPVWSSLGKAIEGETPLLGVVYTLGDWSA